MLIKKRNKKKVEFDRLKIKNALNKANVSVDEEERLSDTQIQVIEEEVEKSLNKLSFTPSVEDIQDLVIEEIQKAGKYKLAVSYITYRTKKNSSRGMTQLEEEILSLRTGDNDEVTSENANKDTRIASTMRDYQAGLLNRELVRKLLPEDVVEAHDKGLLYFHDADYTIAPIHNCDLINLDDMLQNGTVVNGVKIDKPHSLLTATTIASQIIASVASSQFGGQTISLAHLAPFIDVSRQKIKKKYEDKKEEYNLPQEYINKMVEEDLAAEIKASVQCLSYQINTLMTTNGQTPFVSLFIYLGETINDQEKHDLALFTSELFKQRIQGVKAPNGQWIKQTFPKLIYVLDEEDNLNEDSEYYWLTEEAAKCTAHCMVPDYVSAKKMKELKLSEGETKGHGDVYGPMGKCKLQLM